MTEFSNCLSSLVFARTRAGRSFLFQETLNKAHANNIDVLTRLEGDNRSKPVQAVYAPRKLIVGPVFGSDQSDTVAGLLPVAVL